MKSLVSGAIAYVSSLFQGLQVKRFLAVVFVGFILLTSNVGLSQNDSAKAVSDRINAVAHQNDSDRPKTTGEWNQEARETNNSVGNRLQRIGKESAEAVKDFGGLYPDTADRSANTLEDNSSRSNRM